MKFDPSYRVDLRVCGFVLCLLSISYMLGWHRRLVALGLWYGWACLSNRVIAGTIPSEGYVGWLLLASLVIPSGEPLSFNRRQLWKMPPAIYVTAWILLAVGYSISGWDKLKSPSWINGSALKFVFETPIAHEWWMRDLLLRLPESVFQMGTWVSLWLGETLFAPLCLWIPTRILVWSFMVFLHITVLSFLDIPSVSCAMLLIHFFVFDANWLPSKRSLQEKGLIIFFDAQCLLCHRFANFLIEEDRHHLFYYSQIQGKTARKWLKTSTSDSDTIAFKEEEHLYYRSDAILRILSRMGGIWRTAMILYLVPRPVRDGVYQFISARRYQWFGRHSTCRFPDASEEKYLLP